MFLLRTLGGLELLRTGDGGDHAIAMQAKRLALLAHLAALPPNTFRRRDTLLLLFWPDLDQEHARGALRQALHFLRKTLGEGAILTRGEDEIALEPSGLGSDARSLEAALAAGDPQQALTLYRGDFLEGVFVSDAAPELEDWISSERLRLRGLAARAAWMAAELPVNRDNVGDLVRRAVQWSGDDEAALRRGLRLLDGTGDRAGAAALYDEFARRVARDLDIQLSNETRELIRALRDRRDSGGVDRVLAATGDLPAPAALPAREPIRAITSPPRFGRRLLFAGVAGALLVLAIAAKMGPRRSSPPRVAATTLAVMPFNAPGIDSSLAWLPDDIVELLTTRLVGGGTPLADPTAAIAGWHREAAGEATVSHEAARQVAKSIGATRLIEGSIIGTPKRLILSARFASVTGPDLLTRAVAEGPADSLTQLIDQLAAQLLGMNAGMDGAQLAALTGASLPAVRLFAAGQAAFRKGNMESAVLRYKEALDLDSMFVPAGLQLCRAAIWTGAHVHAEQGCRTALAGRERLSSADKALVDISTSEWATASEGFAALHAAVTANPDRPEFWYILGDSHFHGGSLMGEAQWMERASEAFRRGWLLDSLARVRSGGELTVAEPTLHLVQIAHIRQDTAEIVRLAATVLAVDSTSALARTMMWHRAAVTGDSAREEFWRSIGTADQHTTMWIILFILWTGLESRDLDRAHAADVAKLKTLDPGFAPFAFMVEALNEGRPGDIPRDLQGNEFSAHAIHRARLRRAMSWDGDTAAAVVSARVLKRSVAASASARAGLEQLYDTCILGEWQASRGEYTAVAGAIAELRLALKSLNVSSQSMQATRFATLCISLLEAMHASGLGLPDARQKVAAADSTARELNDAICCDAEKVSDANIQIARLWEKEGDLPAAMAALSRRSAIYMVGPMYLSTFAREEGRLALRMGDTAMAISSYRHYLAFRRNPQPSRKPGVDSIRATLAALEAR